eukprot:2316070-Alexandrium_andersonii.AAC.1
MGVPSMARRGTRAEHTSSRGMCCLAVRPKRGAASAPCNQGAAKGEAPWRDPPQRSPFHGSARA